MCVHQASRFVTITCIMQFPAPRLDEVVLQQERILPETHLGQVVAERLNPETEIGIKPLAGRKVLRWKKLSAACRLYSFQYGQARPRIPRARLAAFVVSPVCASG